MLIICHVCAEFHDKNGETVFTVTPDMLTGFITAPEGIREDPLFNMLMADGSLEAGFTEKEKKAREQNPAEGITAEGRKANAARKKNGEPEAEPKPKDNS